MTIFNHLHLIKGLNTRVLIFLTLISLVTINCKNNGDHTIHKISSADIEKDSSWLYTHTLSVETKKSIDALASIPMIEGNLGNQLVTFIKEGVYDYGQVFKFVELRWKDDGSELIQKSRTEIDELARVMVLFPSMRIKMESYTDNQRDAKKLEKITQDRVDYIKKEVVAAGVSPDRIEAKGFGSKYPVADNKTFEGQLINNRIEITILKLL